MNLTSNVSSLPLIGPSYVRKLEKLNIFTIEDLLHHIPNKYLDFRYSTKVSQLKVGDIATVKGEIVTAINQYSKKNNQMQILKLQDTSGSIELIWFNQKYLLSSLKKGMTIVVAGEVSWFGRKKAMVSPMYEFANQEGVHTGRLVPIYPETKGVSSKWIRARIKAALSLIESDIVEFLPESYLKKAKLPQMNEAIKLIHYPQSDLDIINAKKRLAINELLFLHLKSLLRRKAWRENKNAHELVVKEDDLEKFINSLTFNLTKSQIRSINEIRHDLSLKYPMNRLLEGDVGSGKTVVAAAACFIAYANGYTSAFMAPTQILANQHYETLNKLLSPLGVRISLITATGVTKGLGNPDIFVGTHALIHKKANLEKVALVVIDEQHRFGVEQRAHLIKKTSKGKIAPDVLTMTATPIPRTVALTIYADLDLSTLDELPGGRKPITTWIVPSQKRQSAYKWIDEQIEKNNVQVFIVCPHIEKSENELLKEVKAAVEEHERVTKAFPKRKVGLMHGKLKSKEKDEVINKFKKGEIDILVSTPVIEVGIDVPNATIMQIEGADRFGLAALHQLRGRVGRGSKKSYCLLFPQSNSKKVLSRLNAIKTAKNGFELAEEDLKIRGPGEIFGTRQSGFPDFKIASWSDTDLIKEAKNVAMDAMENKDKFSDLFEYLRNRQKIAN